jgi:hypothetical protein
MSVLPTDTFLGKLTIQAVYEYYDKPVLFTCQSAAQTQYLVILLDETDHSDMWLYVALSANRFDQVQRGEITLRDAFSQAEDDIVYEVTIFRSDHPTQIRVLPTSALSDDQLPAAGERLESIVSDNPQVASG